MTLHKQARTELLGKRIYVDAMLKPLLFKLWNKGYLTLCSCQGKPGGPAYVVFQHFDMAIRVLHYVQDIPDFNTRFTFGWQRAPQMEFSHEDIGTFEAVIETLPHFYAIEQFTFNPEDYGDTL